MKNNNNSFDLTFVNSHEVYKGAPDYVNKNSPDARSNLEKLERNHPDFIIDRNFNADNDYYSSSPLIFQLRKWREEYIVTITAKGMRGYTVVGHINTQSDKPMRDVEYYGKGAWCYSTTELLSPKKDLNEFSGTVKNAQTVEDIFKVFKVNFLANSRILTQDLLQKKAKKIEKKKAKKEKRNMLKSTKPKNKNIDSEKISQISDLANAIEKLVNIVNELA